MDKGVNDIQLGYCEVDSIIECLRPYDLVIIGGKPNIDTTSFVLNVAKNIAVDNNQPVAFFSLWHNQIQLVNRLISNVVNVSVSSISNGILSDEEWKRFDHNIGKIKDAPLYIDDSQSINVNNLTRASRRFIDQFGVRIIILDCLQLLAGNKDLITDNAQKIDVMRALKRVALELKVPIVAVSHLKSDIDQRLDNTGKPRHVYGEVAEWNALSENADIIMTITRPDNSAEKLNLKDAEYVFVNVCKNNHNGNLGVAKLRYYRDFSRFESLQVK